MYSNKVKRELSEKLSGVPRYKAMLRKAIAQLREGQIPVVIESWNALWKRTSLDAPMWHNVLPLEALNVIRQARSEQACIELLPRIETTSYQPQITLKISVDGKTTYTKLFPVQEEALTQLVFWGHQDKNFLKILFDFFG